MFRHAKKIYALELDQQDNLHPDIFKYLSLYGIPEDFLALACEREQY